MSEDNDLVRIFLIFLLILFTFLFGFALGVGMGYSDGYDQASEDIKKSDCITKYQKVSQENIPGECLRYFYESNKN